MYICTMKNCDSYIIQQAALEDSYIIRQLASQIWEPTYGEILSPEQLDFMFEWMYSIESIKNQMNSGHTYFIANRNQKPVGYISIEKELSSRYHLQKIYILPSEQGRGLGQILVEYIENVIRKLENNREITLALNVNRNNKARYFYEKIGFSIESQGDFDIGNGFLMNDYIMVKKIEFQ